MQESKEAVTKVVYHLVKMADYLPSDSSTLYSSKTLYNPHCYNMVLATTVCIGLKWPLAYMIFL